MIVTVRDAGSRLMLPFLASVDDYLEENPPPVGSAFSTGTVKLIQNYSAQVLKNFGPSLLIAIVLIFGVMSFMFRSPRQGLVALVPNFFPLLVLLAAMKLLGSRSSRRRSSSAPSPSAWRWTARSTCWAGFGRRSGGAWICEPRWSEACAIRARRS